MDNVVRQFTHGSAGLRRKRAATGFNFGDKTTKQTDNRNSGMNVRAKDVTKDLRQNNEYRSSPSATVHFGLLSPDRSRIWALHTGCSNLQHSMT
jgi:hypothetical protein